MNIVFFDLETTGANPETDRIVHLAAIKIELESRRVVSELRDILINPGLPIPETATAIHGITNEMVADKPIFFNYSKTLAEYFDGCAVGGYNIRHFDVPMLLRQLSECGHAISIPAIIDSYKIFKFKEKRDLAAAAKFYLNQDLTNNHRADVDTIAAMEVLYKQLEFYPDLAAMSPEQLDIYCNGGVKTLDVAGKIYITKEGIPTYAFGTKTKDVPVKDNMGFGDWMLTQNFPENTKAVVRGLLNQYRNATGK